MFLQKLVNGLLFSYYVYKGFVSPLFDSQNGIPSRFYPEILIDIHSWYADKYGDFLVIEKPAFFVGIMWLEVLVQWPLCIANVYAMLTKKSWFRTTCLIHGVSTASGWVAVMSELITSPKASWTLVNIYTFFMVVPLIGILNGLVLNRQVDDDTARSRKKKA